METKQEKEQTEALPGMTNEQKLAFAAVVSGATVSELTDGLLEAIREQYCVQNEGGNAAFEEQCRTFLQQQETAASEAPETAAAASSATEPELNERLADEFLVLRATCPEVDNFAAVPREVLAMALEENVPLRDAYLRLFYRRFREEEAQRETGRMAAESSAGSLSDTAGMPKPEQEAFSRAFRAALR